MADAVHFSSETDEWGTPDDLFLPLAMAFDLQADVCASPGEGGVT